MSKYFDTKVNKNAIRYRRSDGSFFFLRSKSSLSSVRGGNAIVCIGIGKRRMREEKVLGMKESKKKFLSWKRQKNTQPAILTIRKSHSDESSNVRKIPDNQQPVTSKYPNRCQCFSSMILQISSEGWLPFSCRGFSSLIDGASSQIFVWEIFWIFLLVRISRFFKRDDFFISMGSYRKISQKVCHWFAGNIFHCVCLVISWHAISFQSKSKIFFHKQWSLVLFTSFQIWT